MTAALDSLIAELEKAEAGSRELDGKVGLAVGVTPKKRDVYKRGHYAGGKPVVLRVVDVWPPFTTSLDAALTLYGKPPENIPSDPLEACILALELRRVDEMIKIRRAKENEK